ncbi:MAG: FAD-dependent oxidoreductase [Bacteroidetes bacterium MedPE-SWsnd-G1]|nr:MAG: FAD-dependent oxidoreductase [Bacteroidetes bacterium MedPE-SWsnd-G1]
MRRSISAFKSYTFILVLAVCFAGFSQKAKKVDVLVVGGGASGTTAGIQAARLGVKTLIIEETPWIGGMLTSAGVSAIDGNYRLHSGLWEEFRQALITHYGGEEKLKTGWVSNVLFEPHIGEEILTKICKKESNLTIHRNSHLTSIKQEENGWLVKINSEGREIEVSAKRVIDATELGDVVKKIGIPYDIGMDSKRETGEDIAPEMENNIVQDLTYVAVLKDYGEGADKTIEKPVNYNPVVFKCTCAGKCTKEESGKTLWDCDKMMEYGKLPNGYYMVNWPIYGNDYYVNAIEMSEKERKIAFDKAKEYTLNYVYYLQTELGYKNLGIVQDMYPTSDGLPLIPYHRESRRGKGIVRFNINDLSKPFSQKNNLYRTGIAVGDYPVDHHHYAYPESNTLPDLHFYPVPSYSIPLGALIPKEQSNFIFSEKSISVTNLVNGTTRLQPVCLLIGQASGVLAALSVKDNVSPEEVSVRKVQNELLKASAFLMPYSDILVGDFGFKAIQRIGATGILKGEGKNVGWENHTYIYPHELIMVDDLIEGLRNWIDLDSKNFLSKKPSFNELVEIFYLLLRNYGISKSKANIKKEMNSIAKHNGFKNYLNELTRLQFAVLLDEVVNPFNLRDVSHLGEF